LKKADEMHKLFFLVIASFVLSACATKDFVNERVGSEGARLDASIAKVDTNLAASIAASTKRNDERFATMQNAQGATSKLAEDALARANAAHKLAEGKLLMETVMTDDQFRFQFGAAKVNKPAETVLNDLVSKLKADNKNIFIEIQGHTDIVGSADSNLRLGQQRADAVRQYLHKAGIPLHRMSTVSYGKSQPIATGKNRQANAQNRRVVLMVLA
jgi:peptidoglycan-associated lipoprotein